MTTRRTALSLLGTALAAPAANADKPMLNHFYATVDASTYAAVEASTFLRDQFAPFEKRTTVRNDSTYSGLYFYGDQTYFEFFEENQGDRKPGDAGVALGLETATGSDRLRAAWQRLRPSVTTMVTRQLDGNPIDWFQMTSFEETRAQSAVEGLRLFAMQYAPGFVQRWNPAGGASIEQRAILAAYCAKLKLTEARDTSLLENVKRLVIAAPEDGVRVRAAQLKAAGWGVAQRGASIRCQGPNAEVVFQFAPTRQGVVEVEFSLKRAVAKATHQIGRTTLEISPARRAVWRLRP